MSKNLFRIPPELGASILSFLEGNEALIYIVMYKVLNKITDFVPLDYKVRIVIPHMLKHFGKDKDIKSIRLANFEDQMSNILRYKQLEYLKCDSLNRLTRAYLPDLLNLKKFSTRDSGDVLGLDSVLLHPLLEKLSIGLGYDDNKVSQLNLTKYKGFLLTDKNNNDIDLTTLFTIKLEKLEIKHTVNKRRLTSLHNFSQLKSLILGLGCNADLDFNFAEFLPNLVKLELSSKILNLDNISTLKNLKKLKLANVNFNHSKLLEIPDFSEIDELTLIGPININKEQIKLLFQSMTNLKKLLVGRVEVTTLKCLSKSVEFLELFRIVRVAENIQGLVNLKNLIFSCSSDIRHSDMKFINSLKGLESLSFFPDFMKPTSGYDIKGLHKLKKIELYNSLPKFIESFSRYLPRVEIINV